MAFDDGWLSEVGGVKVTGTTTAGPVPFVVPDIGLKYSTSICGVMTSKSFAVLGCVAEMIGKGIAALEEIDSGLIPFIAATKGDPGRTKSPVCRSKSGLNGGKSEAGAASLPPLPTASIA